MQTLKTHFEQIPVETVRRIAQPFSDDREVGANGTRLEPPVQDWRELAQLIQEETDHEKMMEMLKLMMEKFEEEKHRKHPQRCSGQ
jgi:hypothetical protein